MFSKMILTLFFSSLAVVSASGTIQSRQSITLPTECDVIPTWEMTNFRWFNSSSNLDCVTEVDVRKYSQVKPNSIFWYNFGWDNIFNINSPSQQTSVSILHPPV